MVYIFSGKSIGFVLDYVFIFILAWLSSPALVGLFFIAITVINILAMFSCLGLGEGTLRFVSIYNGKNERSRAKGIFLFSALLVLILSSVLSVLLFINARLLADMLNRPGLDILIKAFSLSLPFVSLFKVCLLSFQAFREIKYVALLEGVLLPASMVAFFLTLFRISGPLIALGIAYSVSYLLACFVAFRIINIMFNANEKPMTNMRDYKLLLSFSLPLTFVGLITLTSGQIDALVLGWFRSVEEVGVFFVAFKLSYLCIAILVSVNYVFSSIIADLHNQNEIEKLEKVFKAVTRWIFIISLPIYFILIINSEIILRIFGAQYVAGAIPLAILCTGQLVNFSTGSVAVMLTMIGKNFIALLNSLLFVLLNLILDILLVPVYGITGAAMGFAVSLAAINLIRLLQVYYYLKIHPFSLGVIVPILVSGSIFLFMLFMNMFFAPEIIHNLFYSFLGLIIYTIIIITTIHEEDREIFRYISTGLIKKVKGFV